MLRRLVASLPQPLRRELRRAKHLRDLARGTFRSPEPEFEMLERWVRPGDWVLDLGANVGHYAARFSELVGPTGRVIAFEPVPDTFAVLAAVACACPARNVTAVNAAASSRTAVVNMSMPEFAAGGGNFYQARIESGASGSGVLAMAIDTLDLPRISLVKIDVEGHEADALRGLERLLVRDGPTLIIERDAGPSAELLDGLGYRASRLPHSPNVVYEQPS